MNSSSPSSSSSSSSSSSDEENAILIKTLVYLHEESLHPVTRRIQINTKREEVHNLLVRHYFGENTKYNTKLFRTRFRMSRRLFERIVRDLEEAYPFFQFRWDARGRCGFTPLQKCVSAMRQITYENASDSMDEYLQMSAASSRICLYQFCKHIRKLYGPVCLRKPNSNDVMKLFEAYEKRHGFPGMLGSIDCMHWDWENCPVSWQGQYMKSDHSYPTIVLEAVASQDVWIWHAYFGMSEGNNDLNVLNASQLLNDLENNVAPESSFFCNGNEYAHGYYLADGIYLMWSVFMQTITSPTSIKRKRFQVVQESARKDIERAFGVLKKRFHIIKNPTHA